MNKVLPFPHHLQVERKERTRLIKWWAGAQKVVIGIFHACFLEIVFFLIAAVAIYLIIHSVETALHLVHFKVPKRIILEDGKGGDLYIPIKDTAAGVYGWFRRGRIRDWFHNRKFIPKH